MSAPTLVDTTGLRAAFAERLSTLYGGEVPAYTTLVQACHEVNERVMGRRGADAERFGSIRRVTAERHGAIRVGSVDELRQVSRIFGALGMYPCGFYDLRDASPAPIPVVSTAFRPVERAELAANPFRVFTSMLVPEDRRFFGPDLERRLKNFIGSRRLFPDELLTLADRARAEHGLPVESAERFLDLAAAAFALSPEPVDRAWYEELARVSGVAADIGGVGTTHINHLTPRVLDIDDLYASMRARGIEMIDQIQGPPRWDGPDVLLRQTSFRALAEPRAFREPDGSVAPGTLRVRFGEVEARGVALTPAGRDLYDQLMTEVDRRVQASSASRQEIAQQVWSERMPRSEQELRTRGLGYFTYEITPGADVRRAGNAASDAVRTGDLGPLVHAGILDAKPIVYEDFLPRSAAGIFASNLSGSGSMDAEHGGAPRDLAWLSDALGVEVRLPEQIYDAEAQRSKTAVLDAISVQLGHAGPDNRPNPDHDRGVTQ